MKQVMAFALCVFCATGVAMAQASFQGLGTDGGNVWNSVGVNVTDQGLYVSGQANHTGIDFWEAFRWTADGGYEFLGNDGPGFNRSYGYGMSEDGSVVVGVGKTDHWEPYRWTAATGMVALGYPDPGDDWADYAFVSGDGSIQVGTSGHFGVPRTRHGYRWTEDDGFQLLPSAVPNGYSYAWKISADGNTIVGSAQIAGSGQMAARWTEAEGWVSLGDLPGGQVGGSAFAVSADGSVIAGDSSSSAGFIGQAFVWTEADGMQPILFLPGGFLIATATGVPADGSFVVGVSVDPSAPAFRSAYIWDKCQGTRRLSDVFEDDYGLDLTGWQLVEVLHVSPDGSAMSGYGTNPDGFQEAWIATNLLPAELPLDVKPGSCPNAFNPSNSGVLPVALLGSMDIDINMVDPFSITLSRADCVGGEVSLLTSGIHGTDWHYEDVAAPFFGDDCECGESAPDGYMDIVMHFKSSDLNAELFIDDLPHKADVEVVLKGNLVDGTPFTATDCVRKIGRPGMSQTATGK